MCDWRNLVVSSVSQGKIQRTSFHLTNSTPGSRLTGHWDRPDFTCTITAFIRSRRYGTGLHCFRRIAFSDNSSWLLVPFRRSHLDPDATPEIVDERLRKEVRPKPPLD